MKYIFAIILMTSCGSIFAGQNEQDQMISNFTQNFRMDEYNTGFLLTKIRMELKEEPTRLSKDGIGLKYISCFISTFEINEINAQIALQRFSNIFGEPVSGIAKDALVHAYVTWFRVRFQMDVINTRILTERAKGMFGGDVKIPLPPQVTRNSTTRHYHSGQSNDGEGGESWSGTSHGSSHHGGQALGVAAGAAVLEGAHVLHEVFHSTDTNCDVGERCAPYYCPTGQTDSDGRCADYGWDRSAFDVLDRAH